MRRSFIILSMVAAGAVVYAQIQDDFLGFAWGTPLSAMQQRFALKHVEGDGPAARYTSNIETLGKAAIDDCQLEFTGDKFSGVVVTTNGSTNSGELLKYLEGAFGPGHTEAPLGWQWFTGRTHIWFDEDSAGDGYLYWYSVELGQPKK